MATKTTEKKSASKKAAAIQAAPDPAEALANEVLITLLHRALVRLGEPARISEIVREVGEEAVTLELARNVLDSHPRRFVPVDRRWDITARYLDKQRPLARTLEELVGLYGAPMPLSAVSGELAQVYGRPREYFGEVAPRMLQAGRFFAVAGDLAYGLRAWLLDTSIEANKDILFYNYLTPAALAPFHDVAAKADWRGDVVGAALHVIAAGNGTTVDNRVIQYFAWQALGEDFDAAALYDALHAQSDTFLALSDHRWLLTDTLEQLRAVWRAQAGKVAHLAVDESAVADQAAPDAPAKPLEVTEDDLEEMRQYLDGREDVVTAGELLSHVFGIAPSDRTYATDTQTLIEVLRRYPDDFLWVGTDRFRAPGTLPPYIGQLPESLTFPVLPRFETPDGEILDQTLADEGFEHGLADEVLYSVAQDVNDQEPAVRTVWPEGVSADARALRLVLKAHHKEIGTFPLAQVPPGFFPAEPNIVELTLLDSSGSASAIYVDYDVQLMYGLFDVYGEIAADSGAVFHLEKTDKPAEYRVALDTETDPGVFVSPARLEELAEFRSEVEAGSPISTYDVVRRILDHYRKGVSFLTLLTEVNLIRRTPRRLLASILSGYPAFQHRANRWTFDSKKEPEGFDKRKTGYVVR